MQLSADIKMKSYKIRTSFVSRKEPKALGNKTGINFMMFTLIFVEKCLQDDSIHHFSLWQTTVSSPADINRF